jgi:putative PIN family toxin of toxin-antitoxin system
MRVILDTNVIMSAIFFGGIPGKILDAQKERRMVLIVSPEILSEYQTVAARLAGKFHVEYGAILEWITVNSELVADCPLKTQVSVDPDDDKFIACALSSGSKIICSGDKHLLDVNGYQGVEVLRPKEFVTKYF